MTNLLQVTVRSVNATSRTYIFEVGVCAFESSLLRNSSHIGEAEVQLASPDSELASAADHLSSVEPCLFAEDAVVLMREQGQHHGPGLHEDESARATAVSPHAMAECTVQPLAASESESRIYVGMSISGDKK